MRINNVPDNDKHKDHVDKVVTTSLYDKSYKKLVRDHKKDIVEDISMIKKPLKEDLDEKIDKIFNYNNSIEVVSKETCLQQLDSAIILSLKGEENG